MTDRDLIKAELQNLRNILEDKADMCIGSGKLKLLSFANACSGALELLKKQEPRALTLDEVRERKPFCLWAEDLETGAQVFPVAYVGGLYVDRTEDWSVDPDHRNTPEYYGKSWRFWDKKPTDEQRKAVKWE